MRESARFFLLAALLAPLAAGHSGPFDGTNFKGRIAWSSDGNHNDEDDWAASPTALAIFAGFGVQNRLVHFDYNCILPDTDPAWEKEHEIGVLGAADRYGFNRALFHDCRKDVDQVVASIARAINESSAVNPLYWVIAGPMQVPFMGIQKSDPAKRQFVYIISHSRWNDGFTPKYTFPYNKRAVIPTGIHWVQIQDQNARLTTSPFGRPATPDEWNSWLWMRDSSNEKVRFLWDRMRATRRADCSDAGMAYFLMTGDQAGDPAKLRALLDERQRPAPLDPRTWVRIEAENFLTLDSFELEDADRQASHRLNVKLTAARGRIAIRFDQPYTRATGRYDADVRYFSGKDGGCRLALLVNGRQQGEPWNSAPGSDTWQTRSFTALNIRERDEIVVEAQEATGACRLDYVQLNLRL